jgi:signal transduction histidine kinase/PAS domain-containing protein
MSTLRSSVLIVGHPDPGAVAFGADFAADEQEAKKAIEATRYPVLVLPSTEDDASKVQSFMEYAGKISPLSQRVIIQNDTPAEGLRKLINTGSVFRILTGFDDPKFEVTIREALEEHSLLQQNAKLLQLVNEQNEKLKKLSTDLEERVEQRKKSLEEAKEKLLVTNDRVEALHRALVAIHQATSIGEMERLVNDALKGALGLTWTRIVFQSQARIPILGSLDELARNVFAVHGAPLMRGKDTLGQIYFARTSDRPFMRDENGFLGQVADAVSLAIDRLTKLEQSENLKHQWEATFDAILEPVSLITQDFTVVRINRTFADRSGSEPEKIIGRKCYEALFGRTSPCEGCALAARHANPSVAPDANGGGVNFRLKPARTAGGQNVIYDVFSQHITQQLPFKHDSTELYVNMYLDATEQLRVERQIVDSAKMAELGTIGSSNAHELNNPLGGMLSFLQLIKMDLKGDEPWAADIEEMEKGARRCRDIVQNLLGFTRKSSAEDTIEILDLRDVIEQAVKITELQTRATGIKLTQDIPEERIEIRGHFNALAQTFRGFLQNAQDAIRARQASAAANGSARGEKFLGEINVRLSVAGDWNVVEIRDNGAGFDGQSSGAGDGDSPSDFVKADLHPGLGLSVGGEIIRDHGGRLEIRSTKGGGATAIISLPRPVLDV